MDRLRNESPLLKPLGGADVQIVNLVRHRALEMLVEHVREKVMVAVLVPVVIEGNQEQVPAFQFLQDRLTVNPFPGLSNDGLAERAAKALEDGGPKQKGAHRLGLPLEDLFEQILHDAMMAPGERRDKIVSIRTALHGKCGQL
jgi:hypothetical protein